MKLQGSAADESRFSAGCLRSHIHSVDEIRVDASPTMREYWKSLVSYRADACLERHIREYFSSQD